MVITNLRGNRERTAYTADINNPAGRCVYTIEYRCTPRRHDMRLITESGEIAAYERVDQIYPLSWSHVRAWAIGAAHADIAAKAAH